MRKLKQFGLHIKIAFYSPAFCRNLKDFYEQFQLKTNHWSPKINSFSKIKIAAFSDGKRKLRKIIIMEKAMCHGKWNLPISSLNRICQLCAQCLTLCEITGEYVTF